jgi:hypothetical protein
MATAPSRQASNILPPTSGSVIVAAVTSTGASTNLDSASWYNLYITVQAETADVYILFAATSVVAEALSDVATGSGATVCAVVPAGTEKNFRVQRGIHKYIGYKTATGSATLRMFKSSPQWT